MMLVSDSVSMTRAWIKLSDRTMYLLTCGIPVLVNRHECIKKSRVINSLLVLTGFNPLSLILWGNNQVIKGGKKPAFLPLRSGNGKTHEHRCKIDIGQKKLWLEQLCCHLRENISSSLFMALCVLPPVTVTGKWTNAPKTMVRKYNCILFCSSP